MISDQIMNMVEKVITDHNLIGKWFHHPICSEINYVYISIVNVTKSPWLPSIREMRQTCPRNNFHACPHLLGTTKCLSNVFAFEAAKCNSSHSSRQTWAFRRLRLIADNDRSFGGRGHRFIGFPVFPWNQGTQYGLYRYFHSLFFCLLLHSVLCMYDILVQK